MAKKTNDDIIKENKIEMTCTLELDDGSSLECAVIKIFALDNKRDTKQYVALRPLDQYNDPDGDLYIYRYRQIDGEPQVDYIEDDEEFDRAIDTFAEIMDAEFYDYVAAQEDGEEGSDAE